MDLKVLEIVTQYQIFGTEPYEENEIERAENSLLFPKYDWSTKNR